MSEPPLHMLCAPVAFLLGEWHGEGHGGYPEMQPFRYGEEMRVWHVGKPYLAVEQRTWQLDDGGAVGRLLHGESGYLRCLEGGSIELVVAMAPGHVEVSMGHIEGSRISLESVGVLDAPSATSVSAVKRTWWLEGEVLRYDVEMAALDQPMSWHLSAELRKT
ncbi:MAG: FABP family protein [Candidatus Limnocylindria bacterium]